MRWRLPPCFGCAKVRTMNLIEWLDADDGRGRLTALAAHFGLTQGAVSQWRGNGVPLNRMRAVREFTGGAVTLEEMIPAPELDAEAKAA